MSRRSSATNSDNISCQSSSLLTPLTYTNRRRALPLALRQTGPGLVALEAVSALAAVVRFPADAEGRRGHHQASAALDLHRWVGACDFWKKISILQNDIFSNVLVKMIAA